MGENGGERVRVRGGGDSGCDKEERRREGQGGGGINSGREEKREK